MQMERQDYIDFQKKCKKQSELAYSFTKYECNKYANVVSNEKILNVTVDNLRYFYNN